MRKLNSNTKFQLDLSGLTFPVVDGYKNIGEGIR